MNRAITLISSTDDDIWSVSMKAIIDEVPIFATKKAALEAAKKYGWRDAIQVIRRFDRIWLVGKFDFQYDSDFGVEREVLRVPCLRYETRPDGIKEQPVIVTRRTVR